MGTEPTVIVSLAGKGPGKSIVVPLSRFVAARESLAARRAAQEKGPANARRIVAAMPKRLISGSDPSLPDECAICLEEFSRGDEVAATACRHVYHRRCLEDWVSKDHTCPECRGSLTCPVDCHS